MISVIFATRDDEAALAVALSALVPAATEGIVREVIVVDRESQDATRVIADAAGCEIIEDPGNNGLLHGAGSARSDWFLFLSPAAALEAGWQGEALAFIDRAVLAGEGRHCAAVFRLGRVDPGLGA